MCVECLAQGDGKSIHRCAPGVSDRMQSSPAIERKRMPQFEGEERDKVMKDKNIEYGWIYSHKDGSQHPGTDGRSQARSGTRQGRIKGEINEDTRHSIRRE